MPVLSDNKLCSLYCNPLVFYLSVFLGGGGGTWLHKYRAKARGGQREHVPQAPTLEGRHPPWEPN